MSGVTWQPLDDMGFEYRAACAPDDRWLDLVHASVASDVRFVVHERRPKQLSLRIARHPPREQWREDVDVRVGQDGVYVVFHSATAAEREDVLEVLRAALAHLGCSADFEEI